ncbi:MAG: hypothetical protein EZS28_040301, partial [Streblomastix strix]
DFGSRYIGPTAPNHGIYDSGDQRLRWFGGQASEDFAFEPQFSSYRKEKDQEMLKRIQLEIRSHKQVLWKNTIYTYEN